MEVLLGIPYESRTSSTKVQMSCMRQPKQTLASSKSQGTLNNRPAGHETRHYYRAGFKAERERIMKSKTQSMKDTFYAVPAGTPRQDAYTPAVIHYVGGYIAYSTPNGDYLCPPTTLKPFKRFASEQVQVGTNTRYFKRRKAIDNGYDPQTGFRVITYEDEGTWTHEEEPVFETVKTDDTPDFFPIGKRIVVGDVVTSSRGMSRAFDGEQVLEEITDHYYKVKGMYIPWTNGGILTKV